MHNSQDVGETVITLFDEIMKLGIDKSIRCGIGILAGNEKMETWSANTNQKGEVKLRMGLLDMSIHPMLVGLKKAWQSGKQNYRYDYIGEDVYRYYEALNREPEYLFQADLNALPENEYHRSFFHPEGILFAFAPNPISDEAAEILARFAHVFGQTYRRYRDLLKAEAQSREAQIEAALERVRAKTMAMHKSEDLTSTITTVFAELEQLGFKTIRCGIGIFNDASKKVNVWTASEGDEKKVAHLSGDEILEGHPLLDGIYSAYERQQDYSYVLKGEDLISYYDVVSDSNLPVTGPKENIDQAIQYYHCVMFPAGGLFAFKNSSFSDEAKQLMRRFADVFHLTFIRHLDLMQAEVQARESKIEAALERVRARALAMQEPEELKAVADVMRLEMGKLGVEELETSSIYINDASPEHAECWYAIKDIRDDEKTLVNDYFTLNLKDTWVGREMLNFYRSGDEQVSIFMTGEHRVEWIRYCEEKSVPLRGYYGEVIPDRTYHLYKFSHGAIGAATAGNISEENWNLLKRAASVFSLAYSRFKDLTQARIDLIRLKEEKKRAEDALSELKATQAQLVHAEKMASLGELTAGIAHEIQNPLNFVNNFSEVNSELLEELLEELEKGDLEEVKALIEDMVENEEKIKHHGKRADGIVKGMLQHSRTSTGDKELVDINELADEYLRLAYHGMRAKDKSFNADFELDLDKDLDKILAIPQDLGRAMLNLINNGFYAVDKRAKQQENGFKPKVVVSTLSSVNAIEIRVKDNGTGIPDAVRNKIFQPFFTTKPTGEGTGLGLSLSYDIITKGHGGELTVETTSGEEESGGPTGTTFIIKLPTR
jgi:signal transduction histidine kinase